jgi:hypothetical protein
MKNQLLKIWGMYCQMQMVDVGQVVVTQQIVIQGHLLEEDVGQGLAL